MKLVSTILILSLVGCATQQKLENKLDDMKGAHVDDVVNKWGPPDFNSTFKKTDGSTVYTWTKNTSNFLNGPGSCKFVIFVSPSGLVENWSFSGNQCISE